MPRIVIGIAIVEFAGIEWILRKADGAIGGTEGGIHEGHARIAAVGVVVQRVAVDIIDLDDSAAPATRESHRQTIVVGDATRDGLGDSSEALIKCSLGQTVEARRSSIQAIVEEQFVDAVIADVLDVQ